MSDDDDPFAGLDEALEEEADDEERASSQSDDDSNQTSTTTSNRKTTTITDESNKTGSGIEKPAFEFDDVKQRAFYARPKTWEEFEDALDFETRRTLRDRGAREVPKRELHDAVLQVAANHPEEIADIISEMRRR